MDGADPRAFWVVSPGHGEIRTEPRQLCEPGCVRVRALYSGVSRGTESLVFLGMVPPSEYERMRAPFQAGRFPAPVKYGYSNVGLVSEGPPPLEGRCVFCLFPHQTEYVVGADAVAALPPALPPGRAVLAANMEAALNGVWDGGVSAGDRVSVIGAGTVGCLCAWLVSGIPGCEVELVDVDPAKEEVARTLGVAFRLPGNAARRRDVVLHASGAPSGLATALDLAGFEARIVELSWYGDQSVDLPLGRAFHARRLQLRSSQVGTVAANQRARWDSRRRLAKALELLLDPRLDALITAESSFEDLPVVMGALAHRPGGTICHRVRYESQGE